LTLDIPLKLEGVDGVPGDESEESEEKLACSHGDEGPSPGVEATAAAPIAADDKPDDDDNCTLPADVPVE